MPSTRPPSRKGLSPLELNALATIEEHHMLRPGERVAVACSGGADSTALLHVLIALGRRFGWVVSVAHFNHQLRGAESDEDARCVRGLARTNSAELHESSADVRAHARRTGENLEATARKLRYDFLRSLVKSGKVDRVAVGHTADDQAETVLMRLARGSGVSGRSAILPKLPGGIIRPLLHARGRAVRDWLSSRGIGWREDSSNRDLRLRRNLVRRKLLPLLAEINPSAVETLAHSASLAQLDETFWQAYTTRLWEKHCRRRNDSVWLDLAALRRLPTAAVFRLLRRAIIDLLQSSNGAAVTPSYPQIRSLYRWAVASPERPAGDMGRNQALALPGKIEASRNSRHLIISKLGKVAARATGRQARQAGSAEFRHEMTPPCEVAIPPAGLRCRLELVALAAGSAAYNKNGKLLLDVSRLDFPLLLRSWRPGDAYRPQGRHKSRKLKELFQRHRVPVELRAGWPVLESSGRIIWSKQFGPADGLSASQTSREALLVTIHEDATSK